MNFNYLPFLSLLENIVDNRGKTCPTADSGIPLIATNCVLNTRLYPVFEKIRYVDEETYRTWFRDHPKPGDILFVTKGSPGRVCWVPDPVDFCIAQDMVAIRANKDLVYPKYLFALLRSPVIQKMIENMHVGTLIPHFKKGDFDKLLLPIPSDYKSQEKIGDLYFDLCDKIELNYQTNNTLATIAQTVFKEWFVNFNFPNATGEMSDSNLGSIPKGWRAGKVEEICDLNMNVISKYDRFDWIDYVEISEVSKGNIASVQRYKYGEEPSRAKRKLHHGDTVLSTVRPNRGSYFLSINPPNNMIASTGFAVFSPTKVPFSFLYLLLTDAEKLEYYGQVADGAAYPAINPRLISDLDLAIPDEFVLDRFHSIIEPILIGIMHNDQEAKSLSETRDTLLPKLISGEIEV